MNPLPASSAPAPMDRGDFRDSPRAATGVGGAPAGADAPDVLVVRTPPWDPSLPPLGVAYIVTWLRSLGYRCDQWDLNKAMYQAAPPGVRWTWETGDYPFWLQGAAVRHYLPEIDRWADRLLAFPHRVLGFSVTFISIPFSNALCRRIREKDASRVILWGGPGMAYPAYRDWVDRSAVDYIVARDGEFAVRALLANLGALRPGMDLPGCRVFRDHDGDHAICVQSLADVPLAEVPFPRFEEFNLADYGGQTLPITSSRGCVRLCTFCADTPMYKRYKHATPEQVVSAMRFYGERYDIRRFRFNDLIINGDMGFLEAMCAAIARSGLSVSWDAQGVARRQMTPDVARSMARAGCVGLCLGMESFSDRVLKMMRKGYEVSAGEATLSSLAAAGVAASINVIIGFPGEEESDFQATRDFIAGHRDLITRVANINLCAIHPGTYLFDHAADFGVERGDPFDGYAWKTIDGANTLSLRKQRLRRFLSFLTEISMPHECQDRGEDPGDPAAPASHPGPDARGAAAIAEISRDGATPAQGRLRALRER
ncbi:MAG: radical SAM protein, partial [Planctomycetes bacterium]|nr:radical SAM protein [Planctomycetota bacterium]